MNVPNWFITTGNIPPSMSRSTIFAKPRMCAVPPCGEYFEFRPEEREGLEQTFDHCVRCSPNFAYMVPSLKFLDLYEKESIIWDPTHTSHKRRNEVYDAWKRIQEQLSVQYSITDLKRKKDSLMAIFRTCYNKVKQSSLNGSGEDVYKPSWFAYKKMVNFLKKNDQWEPVINSEDESENESKFEIVSETPWIHLNQKKKRRNEDMGNEAVDPLHQADDEVHYIGLAIVAKLRKIEPSQRILCENLINTVLYKGMTRQLTENTRILEPNVYPHL